MSKKVHTHILNYSGKDAVAGGATLYRASDGMLLAARVDTAVFVGCDPRIPLRQRAFLTPEFAMTFIRRVADADASGLYLESVTSDVQVAKWEVMPREHFPTFAEIDERDMDRLIALPGENRPVPTLQ